MVDQEWQSDLIRILPYVMMPHAQTPFYTTRWTPYRGDPTGEGLWTDSLSRREKGLMGSENKNETPKRDAVVSTPGTKASQKSGFLKRFFDWIAVGAGQTRMRGASCPT